MEFMNIYHVSESIFVHIWVLLNGSSEWKTLDLSVLWVFFFNKKRQRNMVRV